MKSLRKKNPTGMRKSSEYSDLSMITDAHVHMGYYPRACREDLEYYSPRRMFNVLKRCDVREFIVSSTCAQIREIGIRDVVNEAKEMRRVAGERAHQFFWLSGHLYDEDPQMNWMESGLFEGVKFHEGETAWLKERRGDLMWIIGRVARLGFKVQFHCGGSEGCRAAELAEMVRCFPETHFDFAHCRPMAEMAAVIAQSENVWTDTAYLDFGEFANLADYDWRGRLMFGTDLPVWQARNADGLTKQYREYVARFEKTGLWAVSNAAFQSYLD